MAEYEVDDPAAPGTRAYFARDKQRPILLTLRKRDDNKTAIEIRVPISAEPQVQLDGDVFGLPKPRADEDGGRHRRHDAAFDECHRAGAARGRAGVLWCERNWARAAGRRLQQGVAANAGEAVLNFVSAKGPAVLKLGYRYEVTDRQPGPAIDRAGGGQARCRYVCPSDMLADARWDMKDMQQMLRDAGAMTAPQPPAAGTRRAALTRRLPQARRQCRADPDAGQRRGYRIRWRGRQPGVQRCRSRPADDHRILSRRHERAGHERRLLRDQQRQVGGAQLLRPAENPSN